MHAGRRVGPAPSTRPPARARPQVTRLKGQMQTAQGLSADAGLPSHSPAAALPAPVSNGRPPMPAPAFPAPAFSAPAPSLGASLPSVFSGDGKKDVAMYGASVAAVVFFAGVVAPVLEERVGLGGAYLPAAPACCCLVAICCLAAHRLPACCCLLAGAAWMPLLDAACWLLIGCPCAAGFRHP